MNYSEIKTGIEYNQVGAIVELFKYVRDNKPDIIIKAKRDYLIKRINEIRNNEATLDNIQNEIANAIEGNVPDLTCIESGWSDIIPDSIHAMGTIVDEKGNAILGAMIEYSDELIFTNNAGQFIIQINPDHYKSEILIKISAKDKDYKIFPIVVINDSISIESIVLLSSTLVAELDVNGGLIELNSKGNQTEIANLNISSNIIIDSTGATYNDNYFIYGQYINPIEPLYDECVRFPLIEGNNYSSIEGMIDIHAIDFDGNELQIKKNETIKITLPAVINNPPDTVPLAYYDELTNNWVEEGIATLDLVNNVYIGEISHFACWSIRALIPGVRVFCKIIHDGEYVTVPVNIPYKIIYPSGRYRESYLTMTSDQTMILPINYNIEFLWLGKVVTKYNSGPFPIEGKIINIDVPCEKITTHLRIYNNGIVNTIDDIGKILKLYGIFDKSFLPDSAGSGLFIKNLSMPLDYKFISRDEFCNSSDAQIDYTNLPTIYNFNCGLSTVIEGELLYGAIEQHSMILDNYTYVNKSTLDLGTIVIKNKNKEQSNIGSIILYDDVSNEIIIKELVFVANDENDDEHIGLMSDDNKQWNDKFIQFKSRKVITMINKFDYNWIPTVEDNDGIIKVVSPQTSVEWGNELNINNYKHESWDYTIQRQRSHLDADYDDYIGLENETEINSTIKITAPLSEDNVTFHNVISRHYATAPRNEQFNITCKEPANGWYEYNSSGTIIIHQHIDIRYNLGYRKLRLEIRV